MYEKLCAILDELREVYGLTVRAEYNMHYGAWCITAYWESNIGGRGSHHTLTVPIENRELMARSVDDLASMVNQGGLC